VLLPFSSLTNALSRNRPNPCLYRDEKNQLTLGSLQILHWVKQQSRDEQWYISSPLRRLQNQPSSSKSNAPLPPAPNPNSSSRQVGSNPSDLRRATTLRGHLSVRAPLVFRRANTEEGEGKSRRASALIKNVGGGKEGGERWTERWS